MFDAILEILKSNPAAWAAIGAGAFAAVGLFVRWTKNKRDDALWAKYAAPAAKWIGAQFRKLVGR